MLPHRPGKPLGPKPPTKPARTKRAEVRKRETLEARLEIERLRLRRAAIQVADRERRRELEAAKIFSERQLMEMRLEEAELRARTARDAKDSLEIERRLAELRGKTGGAEPVAPAPQAEPEVPVEESPFRETPMSAEEEAALREEVRQLFEGA